MPDTVEPCFNIKTVPSCPAKILQGYQAGEIFQINATGIYEIKTKDKTFSVSIYPFLQTDYLVGELMGKAKKRYILGSFDKSLFQSYPYKGSFVEYS